jgi:PAS domain S-box-containing protein
MPDSKRNLTSGTGEPPSPDPTGDHRAQEGSRAERQRLNDVLNMLPAYVILLSPDYRVPFANRFFEERFGKSNGKRCYEYLFNRTEPCAVCETYTVLKTNAPLRWEWTGPDGRNYDIHDFPFTDVDGSPLIMEVGLDITERKQAEAELAKHREHLERLVKARTTQLEAANTQLQGEIAERKQAEERLRKERDFSAAVLDTAGALIVVLDKEGRITRFNRACEALTGYSGTEVLGRAIWELLIPPEELAGVQQTWEALQAGEFPNQHENHWVAKDGSRRLIAWSNTAIVTPDERIDSIIATGLDITQRGLAEAALERSERLYRAIGESIDYGVWVCEPDGRNIYASPSFLKLVGLTQEQCANFGWGDVLHPDDAARTIAAWKECVRTGGNWDIEHRFRSVDGQWHTILARGVPVRDEQGRVTCWAGINLDINRLKQAEAQISEHAEELGAVNQELTRFNAAMVGRELRMIELKQEINALCAQLGQPPRYPIQPETEAPKLPGSP